MPNMSPATAGFGSAPRKENASAKGTDTYKEWLAMLPKMSLEDADKVDDKGNVKVSGTVTCATSIEARGVSRRILTALQKMGYDTDSPDFSNKVRKWTNGKVVVVQMIESEDDESEDDESDKVESATEA